MKKVNNEWTTFLHKFFSCFVTEWKSNYSDPDILDGTQWKLKIVFEDNTTMEWSGSNAYPPHLQSFLSTFHKFVSKEIK
jgi:hypothetical protein